MNISGYRSEDRQGRLWPEPLAGHGFTRTVLGDEVEAATAAFVGGRRHKTDSRKDYCPDVSAGDIFYECKAVGRTNQVFVYVGRLEKDRRFAATRPLVYAVWHHAAKTKLCEDDVALRAAFHATLRGVYLVPFARFDEICRDKPVELLNRSYGQKCRERSPGDMYGYGMRFSIKELAPWRVR